MWPSIPEWGFGWPASWDWEIDEKVAALIGGLGGAAAVLLFLSPIATFAEIRRERSCKHYSSTPYVIALVQCELWVAYCFLTPHMKSTPLYTNLLGILLEAAYICVFLAFATSASRRQTAALLVTMSVGVAAYAYAVLLLFPAAIGALGDVFNVAMYSAPMGVMGEVIRTKSVDCMPLALSVAGLFCSSVWLCFSIYVRNFIVFLPNICGVALGIAQLALYAAYSRGPGPALTAAADGDAAASSEDFVKAAPHLQEPLLQRSVSAGGIPYDDTDLGADAYALLIGVGGGGGGAGGAGARGSGGAAAEDREAAAALAAAALAWKGGAAKPHEEAA